MRVNRKQDEFLTGEDTSKTRIFGHRYEITQSLVYKENKAQSRISKAIIEVWSLKDDLSFLAERGREFSCAMV